MTMWPKTEASIGSYGICRVIDASRLPSSDPSRWHTNAYPNNTMTPKPSEQYLCLHCLETVSPQEKPKRTFMGFPKLLCPLCKKESKCPLTSGYTAVYWILLVGNALFVLYALSQGGFTPNPIGIIVLIYVVVSLVESTRIKRDLKTIKNTPLGTPLTDFRTYKRMLIAEDAAYASMRDSDLKSGYEEWLATQQARNGSGNANK